MKKYFLLFLLTGLVLSIVIVSCKKETKTNDNGVNVPYHPPQVPIYSSSLAGFGSHPGMPSGSVFTLPFNVKIIGHMYGGNPGKSGKVEVPKTLAGLEQLLVSTPKTNYTEYGYGTFVNIYVKLHNTLHVPYKLIIPSGVILCDSISDSNTVDTSQSGVIIVDDTIVIGGDDTIPCILKSFCINAHYGVPTVDHKYKFTVDSDNDQLNQVIGILRNKKTLADHIWDIQSILWSITDGAGLTEAEIALMNSWE